MKLLRMVPILFFISSAVFAGGKIQNADVKSLSDVGGTASNLINDTKIYDTTNAQQLSTSIANVFGIGATNVKQNYSLSSSVGSSALTVNLTQIDGSSNPSTGSGAVKFGFRSSTAASGAYSTVSATSSTALTVPSGATLGHVSGANEYVWVYVLNNSGTIELAVSGEYLPNAGTLVSTTTISSGATSRTTMYSTTGRSNVPFLLVGVLSVNEATAGIWASAPSVVSTYDFQKIPVITKTPSRHLWVQITSSCSSSPCAIAQQSGEFSSVTRASVGNYTANVYSGFCSAALSCSGGTSVSAFVRPQNTASATSQNFLIDTASGLADGAFNLSCDCLQ